MQLLTSQHQQTPSHPATDGYKKVEMRNKICHAQTAWLCYLKNA
jgi:hypothetical protein